MPLTALAAAIATLPVAAENCPSSTTKYTISLQEPDRAQVEISLTLASENLLLGNFVADDGVEANSFVEKVKIASESAEIMVDHAGGGAWPTAPFKTGDAVKVTYDLLLEHDGHPWPFGKEEIGVRMKDSAYLVSRAAMLADYGAPNCPIEVEFNTTDSAAPWSTIGDNHYRAASVPAFHNNAFAFGEKIGRLTAKTDQGRVTFIHDKASKTLAEQAARDMKRTASHLTNIFGGFPASNYHIFLFEHDRPEGGAFEDSFAMLHPAPPQKVDALIWRQGFIHEIIHLWLGHSVRPAPGADIEWFKEGFTDYLAIKTMWRLSYIDEDEFADKLENLLRRHTMGLFLSEGKVRLSEAGENKAQNRMMIYGSGATLAFLLDVKMSATQKTGAFEKMLASLYSDSQEPYTQERLLSALDLATNGVASQMLSQFDNGVMPMQIADIVEPYGIEMAFMIPDMFALDLDPRNCNRRACKPAFLRVPRTKR